MTTMANQSLDDLILSWLSVSRKTRPSPSDLTKGLYPFVALRLSVSEWRNVLSERLTALRGSGLVEATALGLTDAGRERLSVALQLETVAATKSWRDFKRRFLPRMVLPHGAARSAPIRDLAATVVGESLQAPAETLRTRTTMVDGWLRRKLGITSKKVGAGSLRAALLAKELGVPVRSKVDDVVRLAAAKATGARSGKSDDVLQALTIKWLTAADTERPGSRNGTDSKPMPGNGTSNPEANSRRAFAEKVRAAVRVPEARRFGSHKVFISSAWELLRGDPEIAALGEQGFKRTLVEAHRAGDLVLARADLVAAMDPEDVAASETRHLNASYHFIEM